MCEHKRFQFLYPGFTRPALQHHVLGMTQGRKGALISCNMNVQQDTEMALKSAIHQSSHIGNVHWVHGHMLIKNSCSIFWTARFNLMKYSVFVIFIDFQPFKQLLWNNQGFAAPPPPDANMFPIVGWRGQISRWAPWYASDWASWCGWQMLQFFSTCICLRDTRGVANMP